MPTQVQLPDGNTGEFPDGMDHSAIEAVLQKQYPKPAAEREPEPTFGNTLGREAKSLGSTIIGAPGGLYHAFADPPTAEESEMFNGDVHGAKRVGLGIGRLIAIPIKHAYDWYKDAAQGKIPDATGQALEVAPEAIGMGAAAPITSKAIESAPAMARTARAAGPPIVRGVAKGTNAVLEKAPGSVGAAIGSAVGHATRVPFAGTAGAGIGYALGKEILPKLRVPGENFGIKPPEYPGAPLPASPDTPLDGEYVNSNPIAPQSVQPGARHIPADVVNHPLLPEHASPARDLPYRRVSGEVEPEDVNTPNPRVLGRNKGIITTRKGLLAEGRPESQPEPSEMPVYRPELSINRSNRVGRADAWEDKGIQDSLRRNMEYEPVRLQRQESEDTQAAYPRAFRGPKFSRNQEPTDLTEQLQASVDHVRDTNFYQQAGKELGQNAPIRAILARAQELKDAAVHSH